MAWQSGGQKAGIMICLWMLHLQYYPKIPRVAEISLGEVWAVLSLSQMWTGGPSRRWPVILSR